MPDLTLVDQWLDQWEKLRESGKALTLGQFITRYCQGSTPELIARFQDQVRALESMDRRLKAAGTQSGNSTSKAGNTVPAGDEIKPGSEPIPGYVLVCRLGEGGFGEVWKARAPGGFHVALKFVRLERQVQAAELRALETIKEIRHPNLLSVFGSYQKDGRLIIAMELAERTLAQRFREVPKQRLSGIPREELHEYMAEAAKGLDYLNEPRHPSADGTRRGIQHRDIKPQNLLLSGGGVKVGDYGLVRWLENSKASHTGSMTVAYAAPEFFKGQTTSHSDQYSLAVTYCELRGGRLPFKGNDAEMMNGHLSRKPDLSMLPPEEQPIVARALAKEAKNRWPSCGAFVKALRQAKPGKVKATTKAPKSPARPKKPAPKRWLMGGAVVLLGAVAAGVAIWFGLGQREDVPGKVSQREDIPGKVSQREETPGRKDSFTPAHKTALTVAEAKKDLATPAQKTTLAVAEAKKDVISPAPKTTVSAIEIKKDVFTPAPKTTVSAIEPKPAFSPRGFGDTILKYADRSYDKLAWKEIQAADSLGLRANLGDRIRLPIKLHGVIGWSDDSYWVTGWSDNLIILAFHYHKGNWALQAELDTQSYALSRPRLLGPETLLFVAGNRLRELSPRGTADHGAVPNFAYKGEICPVAPDLYYLFAFTSYDFPVFKYGNGKLTEVKKGNVEAGFIHRDENILIPNRPIARIQHTRALGAGKVIGIHPGPSNNDDEPKIVSYRNDSWYEVAELPKCSVNDTWVYAEGGSPRFLVAVGQEGEVHIHHFGGPRYELSVPAAQEKTSRRLLKVWGVSAEKFWVMDTSGTIWQRTGTEWHVVVRRLPFGAPIVAAWVSDNGTVIAITRFAVFQLK